MPRVIKRWNGLEQPLCIRVLRIRINLLDRASLDDLSGVHDDDPITHLRNDTQVVCDEQYRHTSSLLNVGQQV